MSEAKTYNGWTNYETWNVALWIGNEEGSHNYWQERTEEAYRDQVANLAGARVVGRDEWTHAAAVEVSEALKFEFEENNPLKDRTDCYADLMNAALSEVNWYEIAKNWIEDLDRDEIEAEASGDESDDE